MSSDSYPASATRTQLTPPASSSSKALRLPRLDALDDGTASTLLTPYMGRQRSVSSASYHDTASPVHHMAAFVPRPQDPGLWSGTSHPPSTSDANIRPTHMLLRGSSSAGDEFRQLTRPSRSFMATPVLPKPQRRSTMLLGALPPLAALASPTADHGYRSSMHSTKDEGKIIGTTVGSSSGSTAISSTRWISADSVVFPPHSWSEEGWDGKPKSRTISYPPKIAHTEASEAATDNRKTAKAHVSSACLNCKRAHLACDAERPCRRCSKLGKTATCVDVQHKKRGRPRLKEREHASIGAMKTSPIASSGSTDSGWSPVTDPTSQFFPSAARPPAWSSSPEAQDMRSNLPLAISGRSRTFSAASTEMIAMNNAPSRPGALVTTVLCGTDLVAAHVSQELQLLFGLLPSQLCHRSLLSLVYTEDVSRFNSACRRLLTPVELDPSPFPSTGWDLMNRTSCKALRPARGTIYVEDTIRMGASDRLFVPCSVRLHLGGAFGLDLYRPETKQHAFVVCSTIPIDRCKPQFAASRLHPDAAQLSATEYPAMNLHGEPVFRSSMGSPPLPSMAALSVQSHPALGSHHHVTTLEGQMTQSPLLMDEWKHEGPPKKKRSYDGEALRLRDPAPPLVSRSPSSPHSFGSATLAHIDTGSDKAIRSSLASSLLRNSNSSAPLHCERYGKRVRVASDARMTCPSPPHNNPHGEYKQQIGLHRPFSSAALPFSLQRPSVVQTFDAPFRSAAMNRMHSTPMSERNSGSSHWRVESERASAGRSFGGVSSNKASIKMERNPSATSAPCIAHGGGPIARLAGGVSSLRSTEGVADGMGTVMC